MSSRIFLLGLAALLTACGGSTPTPLLDAGDDAADDDGPAVVTVIACEVGEPCAVDAGAD